MVLCMGKTTLNLDGELVKSAKKLAADRGVTLTSIIEEGLRMVVAPLETRAPRKLRWTTVRGRRAPRVDISDRDELFEWMEGRR
jgi:hypothetical protein